MSNYIPCPACGSQDVKKIWYTPQGGMIWTPFLNFAKCRACRTRFDGRSGQLNPQIPKIFRIISVIVLLAFLGTLGGFVASL